MFRMCFVVEQLRVSFLVWSLTESKDIGLIAQNTTACGGNNRETPQFACKIAQFYGRNGIKAKNNKYLQTHARLCCCRIPMQNRRVSATNCLNNSEFSHNLKAITFKFCLFAYCNSTQNTLVHTTHLDTGKYYFRALRFSVCIFYWLEFSWLPFSRDKRRRKTGSDLLILFSLLSVFLILFLFFGTNNLRSVPKTS